MTISPRPTDGISLIRGIPLDQEQGIGALTLAGYILEVTGRFGPREAACVQTPEGVARWSYDDLGEHSMALARALVACGVGKGTRVGILATNRLEFLAGFFGTALAGGIATPLSTFSTLAELEILLRASCCSVVLLERHVLKKDFARMLIELEPQVASAAAGEIASPGFPHLRHLAMVDSDESVGAIEGWSTFLKRGALVLPELVKACASQVAPSDPGALFFSSGSTGKPKGILSAHRGVCLQLWRWPQWFNFQHVVRIWTANGFFWSGNVGMAVGGALSSGGTLVLQRYFQPDKALEFIAQEKVTTVYAWPHQMAQLEASPKWPDVDLTAVHYFDHGTYLKRHPTVSTDWCELRYAYGTTETFTNISVYPAGTPYQVGVGTHGIPTAGSTIKIVEPLTGETLPVGERGEIAVKGPTLMLGYIGIPLDETLDDNGFYRTGDGGYIDDKGRLVFEGRLNDIIKTGGANVSPIEINVVIAKCPGVKATQTVGVPDELLGELVVTCIIPHAGASLDEEVIRDFAKEKLASYKVPRRVLFFEEGDFNTTGTAKIRTAELRKLAAQRLETSG